MMIKCIKCGKEGWQLADCCMKRTWKGMYFYSRVRHETADGKRSTCYIFKEKRSRLKHLDMLDNSPGSNTLDKKLYPCRKSALIDIPKKYRKTMTRKHEPCTNPYLLLTPLERNSVSLLKTI